MHDNLIALLENSGFITDGKPNGNAISKATLSDIQDFCKQFSDISTYENANIHRSIYTHGASRSLCCGNYPCATPKCRLEKADELAQFATLYSDRVYINNFLFDRLIEISNLDAKKTNSTKTTIKNIRTDFQIDILVLTQLLPLIKAGLVVPITFRFCCHCLTMKALKHSSAMEYELACREIADRYYDEVNYSISFDKPYYVITAYGPESLIPHGHHLKAGLPGPSFTQLPKTIIKRLQSGIEIPLTRTQAKKINAGDDYVEELLDAAAFELGSSQFLGSAFLTDSELEVSFIRNLTSDPVAKRRTALMQKYLNCLVPFMNGINPDDLIKLRNSEGDAFILFRNALSKAVEEYKTNGASFSERDAQAVYGDIVQPHLAELDVRFKKAKKLFASNRRGKLIKWGGAISVGLFTSFFTSNPASGAAAFAATKTSADILGDFTSESNAENQLRDDAWYFLWRVKKLAK